MKVVVHIKIYAKTLSKIHLTLHTKDEFGKVFLVWASGIYDIQRLSSYVRRCVQAFILSFFDGRDYALGGGRKEFSQKNFSRDRGA